MNFRAGQLCGRLSLALSLLASPAALAAESAWSDTGKAQVRLLAGGETLQGTTLAIRGGLEIKLERGWHTYWRHAGDAGFPPQFDWSGSVNLRAAEILWPAPSRIRVDDDIESIGYKDAVVLPIRFEPADPAKPVLLRLNLDFGVCEKICIPANAKLALDVPAGSAASRPALLLAESRVPKKQAPGQAGELSIAAVKLERGAQPRALIDVTVPAGAPFDLFAEGPTPDWGLPLPRLVETGAGGARFELPIDGAPSDAAPVPKQLRLTLVAGRQAIEVDVPLD